MGWFGDGPTRGRRGRRTTRWGRRRGVEPVSPEKFDSELKEDDFVEKGRVTHGDTRSRLNRIRC